MNRTVLTLVLLASMAGLAQARRPRPKPRPVIVHVTQYVNPAQINTSQINAQNINTDHLTVSGDALFLGTTSFGQVQNYEGSELSKGFSIDVVQATGTRDREVWVPPTTRTESYLQEIYGQIMTEVQVQDYGWVERSYWEPAVMMGGDWVPEMHQVDRGHMEPAVTRRGHWLEEGETPGEGTTTEVIDNATWVHDPNGAEVVVVAEHWVEDWQSEPTGYNYQTPLVEVTPAQWVSSWLYEPTGSSHMENSYQQGITGYETLTHEVMVDGYYTTEQVPSFLAPDVRFTAERSDTSWVWRVPDSGGGATREIARLSDAGLGFPTPGDASLSAQTLLSHQGLSLQYTGDSSAGGGWKDDVGVLIEHDGLQVWNRQGVMDGEENFQPASDSTVTVDGIGLMLTHEQPTPNGESAATVATRITADNATFGGGVNVKGVLRVMPAGDLSMGAFTSGPQP